MKNAAVSAALEGRWTGSLDVGGTQIGLILTIANRARRHGVGADRAGVASRVPGGRRAERERHGRLVRRARDVRFVVRHARRRLDDGHVDAERRLAAADAYESPLVARRVERVLRRRQQKMADDRDSRRRDGHQSRLIRQHRHAHGGRDAAAGEMHGSRQPVGPDAARLGDEPLAQARAKRRDRSTGGCRCRDSPSSTRRSASRSRRQSAQPGRCICDGALEDVSTGASGPSSNTSRIRAQSIALLQHARERLSGTVQMALHRAHGKAEPFSHLPHVAILEIVKPDDLALRLRQLRRAGGPSSHRRPGRAGDAGSAAFSSGSVRRYDSARMALRQALRAMAYSHVDTSARPSYDGNARQTFRKMSCVTSSARPASFSIATAMRKTLCW